jgi:hypothetical protein
MAEGSKPDVPLFQLLADLLQQVRRYASAVPDLSIDPVPLWPPILGRNCLAAALIWPTRSITGIRRCMVSTWAHVWI